MALSRLVRMTRLDTVRVTDCDSPPSRARNCSTRDPWIGRVLLRRYRVLERIGSGSAGAVYRAEQLRTGRLVAVKIMHPPLTAASEHITRFHREARVSTLVRNQHIVDVIDMGQLEEGPLFLAMEYLEGPDAARIVASHGAVCVPRVAEIGLQICSALEAVHRAGVVHRDLKPEHVFLIQRGQKPDFVKLVDFGMCKFASGRANTGAGIALGTPRFMAPEQLEARPDVDARADLYALGGILFFMLTGTFPFDGASLPELLMRVWEEPAPRLLALCPDAPAPLDGLIDRALRKDRNARPSHREFRDVLAAFAPSATATATATA
jgi:eukaryotic-like serine/threonine-protein kinase